MICSTFHLITFHASRSPFLCASLPFLQLPCTEEFASVCMEIVFRFSISPHHEHNGHELLRDWSAITPATWAPYAHGTSPLPITRSLNHGNCENSAAQEKPNTASEQIHCSDKARQTQRHFSDRVCLQMCELVLDWVGPRQTRVQFQKSFRWFWIDVERSLI